MLLLILAAWLVLAVAAGGAGLMRGLPFPFPPLVILVLTLAASAAAWGVPAIRERLERVDLRWLVGVHLVRFVGIAFLVLHSRGRLPYDFAGPAGWGDIAVASGALLLVVLVPPRGRGAWAGYAAWNVAGLADIALAVFLGAGVFRNAPALMEPLTVLPLSLVPTFLVPAVIVTHLVVFARLARAREEGFGDI